MTTTTTDAFTTDLDLALAGLQAETNRVNTANGWHDSRRRFSAGIGLLHSEISEALEAYRDHGFEDVTESLCIDRGPHLTGKPHLCKPEGVGSELADVLIRLLDECERIGFLPVRSVMAKFVPADGKDFEDLIPVLHADATRLFEHVEAAESMAAIMLGHLSTLADRFGFDLLAETRRKLAFNETRGYKHGGKRL